MSVLVCLSQVMKKVKWLWGCVDLVRPRFSLCGSGGWCGMSDIYITRGCASITVFGATLNGETFLRLAVRHSASRLRWSLRVMIEQGWNCRLPFVNRI